MQKLVDAAARLGFSLDEGQQLAFRGYFDLLEQGRETANLTGAHGWERVRDELFIRSLRLLTPAPGGFASTAEWFGQLPGPGTRPRRVMDVGSGAGVPGLVLKIVAPAMDVTLLDSSRKKCAFLRKAVGRLGLSGVTVLESRAEDAANDAAHREAYDLVVCRAVARLSELAELTLPFAAVGGSVIAAKGEDIDDEVAESAYAAEMLGAAPALTQVVRLPGDAPPDTLVYWFKVSPTPARYPRRAGMPHKHPLIRTGAASRGTAHAGSRA